MSSFEINNPNIKTKYDDNRTKTGGQNSADETSQTGGSNSSEKTLFSKTQFTNSIMSALGKGNLDSAQTAQFKQEASSIFSTYDNSPQDNKWSQTEANNGGAAALASFYQKVNDAINGITKTSKPEEVSDVSGASEANQASTAGEVPSEAEINAARAEFANKFMNATPEEQKAILQQEINDFKAAGYDITSMSDDGTMTIKNPDGTTNTMNIFDAMGVERPAANNDTATAVNNLGAALDKYAQDGFQPIGNPQQKTINGEKVLVGTLQNQSGEQIQINMKTGEEIKE